MTESQFKVRTRLRNIKEMDIYVFSKSPSDHNQPFAQAHK